MSVNFFNKYHPYWFSSRKLKECMRIDVKDVVAALVQELSDTGLNTYSDNRIRTVTDAEFIQANLNKPTSTYGSLISIQSNHLPWQEFEFVNSNLGNGFIFYFICCSCTARVKHLYMREGNSEYLCRRCNHLIY